MHKDIPRERETSIKPAPLQDKGWPSNHLSHSGWEGSFISSYRHHITMVPTRKPMVKITRGLSKAPA